jgi:hypothetical protein
MDEASDRFGRCRVLPARVEIMLATHEVAVARKAADELFKIAEELEAPFLRTGAAYAQGAVSLAEGDPAGALTPLRRALSILGQPETPYEQLGTRPRRAGLPGINAATVSVQSRSPPRGRKTLPVSIPLMTRGLN